MRTGFQIYYNIILNTGLGATEAWQGAGIDSNSPDYVSIWNNDIYNPRIGIQLEVVNWPVQAGVVNNMIVNPQSDYYMVIGAAASTNLVVDYNLLYPSTTFSTMSVFAPSFSHDQHSIMADPLFATSPPAVATDFDLRPGSPAVNAGTPVGLSEDFFGRPVPWTQPPYIGASQLSSLVAPPLAPAGLHLGP